MSSKTGITGPSIPWPTPVHVAYLPLASMKHQWTINLHDEYCPSYVLIPVESIPPSVPTLCHLMSSMFHFGVDLLHFTKEPKHDLLSLAPPKGEMASSFSWTSLFKSPTPRTICLGVPTLANLNQVKLFCETKFGATKTISFMTWCLYWSHISVHIYDKTKPGCHQDLPSPILLDQVSLDEEKFILDATKPHNTKTLPHKPKKVSVYLQEESSIPPSDEPSGDIEEVTNPDKLTQIVPEDASDIDKVVSTTEYISIYMFYILFKSREVQEFKNYQNTSSTSKVTSKTIIYNFV